MKMKFKTFLFFSLLFSNFCFSEKFIYPTKYEHQEEILVQGASVILSKKTHSISMYQTSESLYNRKANFYFSVLNNTEKNVNFYFSNLKVTDQWGRDINVVDKSKLIAQKKSEKNWKAFGSALCTGLESMDAQKAGTINYQTKTHENHYSNYNIHGSNGWAHGSSYGVNSSTTTGTIHCEALRQHALRQVEINSQYRNDIIQMDYQNHEYDLNNFYFDSTTLFPGNLYAANFQIDIPKNIEKNLQYLIFTYDIGGENHTFCFYCEEGKRRK
jgi:hypothetical protein